MNFCFCRYEPKNPNENSKTSLNTEYVANDAVQEAPSNKIITSTLLGTISVFSWEGFLFKEGKPEVVKLVDSFAAVHDGPVLHISRNPFITDLMLSIGGTIFALWNTNFPSDPLLWRKQKAAVNCCQWSSVKPSLFFLGYSNGVVELWDLLVRTSSPLLAHEMGNYSITTISQHSLPSSSDLLLVGDHRAAVRILKIPESITKSDQNDQKV